MRTLFIAFALAALAAPMYASAQGRANMGSILNEKKPRMLQLQLLRTSPLCGSVTDCSEAADLYRPSYSPSEPCVTDMVSCHMAITSGANGHSRAWNVGGAKLSAVVGRVTFTFGRNRKTLALARVPFIEGSYRLEGNASLAFGVLHQRYGAEKHPLAYLVLHKELW